MSTLSLRDKILVAALRGTTAERPVLTSGDLTVLCFQHFPDAFVLASELAPGAHPDANKVLAKVSGVDGLLGLGLLERVATSVYRLTRKGRTRARQLDAFTAAVAAQDDAAPETLDLAPVEPEPPPPPPPPKPAKAPRPSKAPAPAVVAEPASPPPPPPSSQPVAPRHALSYVEKHIVRDLAAKQTARRFCAGKPLTEEDARLFWTAPRGLAAEIARLRIEATGDLLERVAANVGAGHEDPELPPPNTCLTLRSLHRLLVTTHGARIASEVRP